MVATWTTRKEAERAAKLMGGTVVVLVAKP
jgi:hypothetical protein